MVQPDLSIKKTIEQYTELEYPISEYTIYIVKSINGRSNVIKATDDILAKDDLLKPGDRINMYKNE